MAGDSSTGVAPGGPRESDSSDLLRRHNEALLRLLEYAGVDVPAHVARPNGSEARRFAILQQLLEEDVLSELEERS